MENLHQKLNQKAVLGEAGQNMIPTIEAWTIVYDWIRKERERLLGLKLLSEHGQAKIEVLGELLEEIEK